MMVDDVQYMFCSNVAHWPTGTASVMLAASLLLELGHNVIHLLAGT
jgi:hypothetical protein